MADIQFNEEQEFVRAVAAPKQSTLIRWALASGIVTTERGANYLLLGIAAFCLVATFFVLFSGGNKQTTPTFAPGESVMPVSEIPAP